MQSGVLSFCSGFQNPDSVLFNSPDQQADSADFLYDLCSFFLELFYGCIVHFLLS